MFISRFIQANYFKKYFAENAVNTISEPLDFKILWGRVPPDPPTNSRLRRSFSAPPHLEIRSAVPGMTLIAALS